MELNTVKDAFDRAVKKQKLSSTKCQELVDQLLHEIEAARLSLATNPLDQSSILGDLKQKLDTLSPHKQLEDSQGDLNTNMRKYTKVMDKLFTPDITKAHRNVKFDQHIMNQIVANHFYQAGLFEIGDCFIGETEEPESATLKSQFTEMYRILDAMKAKNLVLALTWVKANHDKLGKSGSDLEMRLHRLQFVEILQRGDKEEALGYARKNLSPFAGTYMDEIQKLMACLLWAGRLENSPYADLIDPVHSERLARGLVREFCTLLGRAWKSPLRGVVDAGHEALPTLLKLAGVMAGKKQEWEGMKQLPVPVELSREFQFHSVFVCPVSRDQGSEENPPMLMPCGHVLCRHSIVKLSKSSSRTFKCPYCPHEASVSQCKQLFF